MDGILIINKPQWYTSFDVVAKCRKVLGTKKIGHTGTLDPMATGVLVVCVGKATGLVNVLTSEDKIYRTTIKLGIKTDTGDMAGKIIGKEENPVIEKEHLSDITKKQFDSNMEYLANNCPKFDISKSKIEEIFNSFIGKQNQIPPIYSSIKVDGKKLYDYAREGKKVEIPPREIEVFDIYDIEWNNENELSYTVHCSKGTYIRTLNEDIATKLGAVGTTMALERIKTGDFCLENATDIEDVSEEFIIPIEELFNDRIEIDERNENKLLNGMSIDVSNDDGIYNLYINNNYYGLGKVINKKLKRFIIL